MPEVGRACPKEGQSEQTLEQVRSNPGSAQKSQGTTRSEIQEDGERLDVALALLGRIEGRALQLASSTEKELSSERLLASQTKTG